MGQSFGIVVRPDFIDTTINYCRTISTNNDAFGALFYLFDSVKDDLIPDRDGMDESRQVLHPC